MSDVRSTPEPCWSHSSFPIEQSMVETDRSERGEPDIEFFFHLDAAVVVVVVLESRRGS
jgi:hypothetical protein